MRGQLVKYDEEWFNEIVKHGLKLLEAYLAKWAEFDQYLAHRPSQQRRE